MSRPPERASLEELARWLRENVDTTKELTKHYSVGDLCRDLERRDYDRYMD